MGILTSRHLWAGILLAAVFLPLTWLPRAYMFDIVNAMTVAVGTGVLVAYAPGIYRSFKQRQWNGSNYLVLGIFVAWLALTTRHLWNWLWRYLGQPQAMIDHPFVAFLVWLAFMGGTLHLAARGAIDGVIPKDAWIRLGIAVATGVVLAMLVIVFLEPLSEGKLHTRHM